MTNQRRDREDEPVSVGHAEHVADDLPRYGDPFPDCGREFRLVQHPIFVYIVTLLEVRPHFKQLTLMKFNQLYYRIQKMSFKVVRLIFRRLEAGFESSEDCAENHI